MPNPATDDLVSELLAGRLPPLLTYREAADVLRVTPKTIRNWVDRGRLKAVNLNTVFGAHPDDRGMWRVSSEQVVQVFALLDRSTHGIG